MTFRSACGKLSADRLCRRPSRTPYAEHTRSARVVTKEKSEAMKILSMAAAAALMLATAGIANAQTTPGCNQKAAGEGGTFNTLAGGANNQKAAGEGGAFNTLAGGANNQKAAGEAGPSHTLPG